NEIGNPVRSVIIQSLLGQAIAPPPGAFLFAYPKVVWDTPGRLQLIWGEPEAGERPQTLSDWHALSIPPVWTAMLDAGSNTWTRPEVVSQTRELSIEWEQAQDPAPTTGRERRFGALMPIADRAYAKANDRRAGRTSMMWLFQLKDGHVAVSSMTLP